MRRSDDLTTNSNEGATWSPPRVVYPAGQTGGEWDAQIAVDPVDGRRAQDRRVAAGQERRRRGAVRRATSGRGGMSSWPTATTRTDKPIRRAWSGTSTSRTTTRPRCSCPPRTMAVARSPKTQGEDRQMQARGWALAGGGDARRRRQRPRSWAGYERNGGATGRSSARRTTEGRPGTRASSTSPAPPDCSAAGGHHLGAQATPGRAAGCSMRSGTPAWSTGDGNGSEVSRLERRPILNARLRRPGWRMRSRPSSLVARGTRGHFAGWTRAQGGHALEHVPADVAGRRPDVVPPSPSRPRCIPRASATRSAATSSLTSMARAHPSGVG